MSDRDKMMAMATERNGGPELLRPMQLARPRARPHEVVVRVHGSSVNPADLRARCPRTPTTLKRAFPLVLGYDFSGVLVECGATVTELRVGYEVFGSPGPVGQGAHAEYVAVDARLLARKPRSLSHREAGVAPLVCLTAFQALFERARIEPGQTVLIHGGGGGVGHVALQLAKWAGCRVIATAGRPASEALCHALGADEVINYEQENFAERTLALTHGNGADAVLDSVGGSTLARSAACTRALGQLVTLVPTDFSGAASDAFMRGLTLHYVMMWTRSLFDRQAEAMGDALGKIADLLDRGVVRVVIHRHFALGELAAAHQLLEAGGFEGKLAIDVVAP